MNDFESLLMKIVLSDNKNAGTVKELWKDFNIYQKSKQSILLRVLVPKSLIGDKITNQYFDISGQMITESGIYTALKMGMVRVDDRGKKTKTESFYLRFIKEIKTKKGEFYIYERMLPSVFTLVAGVGINAPKIVFNLVNILNNISIDSSGVIIDEPTIVNKFTTQECKVDVLPSTDLDQDASGEPGEMELLQGKVDDLLKNSNSKADKDVVVNKYDLKEDLPSDITFNLDGYKTPNVLFLNAEYDLPNIDYGTDSFVGSVLVTNARQDEILKQVEVFFYDNGVSQRIIELNQDLSVKSIGDWSIKVDRKQNIKHIGEFLYVDKKGNINFTKALKDLITRSQGELLTEDTSSYDFSSMFNVTATNKEEVVVDGSDELKAVIKEVNFDLENGTLNFERYNGKSFNFQFPTKLSQFENDTEFITKDVNNLTNYTLTDKVGNRITFLVDPLTYILTINLLNPKGDVISTGQVDLPLETMVVSASYDNGYVTLTLQNGETTRFSIAALVSGLVPSTRKINGKPLATDIELFIPENLSDLIEDATHRTVTDAEKTKWNNKVDKVNGKGLSSNDFTNELKSDVENNTKARHSHSNKVLLDTYKQTETNIADAVSKKHTHSNKSILDNTTASYTTAEKNKLANVSSGAEANVQSDWNQTDLTADDYIKNKPIIPEGAKLYSDKGNNTDGAMTQKAASEIFAVLKSNQSFSGQNTFTQELIKSQPNGYTGFQVKNTSYKIGTENTSDADIGLGRYISYDGYGNYLGYTQYKVLHNSSTVVASFSARQATEEGGSSVKNTTLNLFASPNFTWANLSGTFQPASTNSYSLGEPNFRWKSLYLANKIDSNYGTTTYLSANQGNVPFNIDRPAGSFNMIANVKSTNGTYLLGAYQTAFRLYYSSKTLIDAGTNNITKSWSFNEDGTMTTTAPSSNDNSTKVPTTAWVNSTISNITNNTVIIKDENGGFTAGNGTQTAGNIVIGNGASASVYNKLGASISIGTDVKSTGEVNVGLGYKNTLSGSGSVAIGIGATAVQQSLAIGSASYGADGSINGPEATGRYSVAIGLGAHSTKDDAISIKGTASGNNSIGIRGTASGNYSIGIGYNSKASGSKGISIGYGAEATHFVTTEANMNHSIAIGAQAKATKINSIQLGTGTNTTENTLQIFSDNIYNHNTHSLSVNKIFVQSKEVSNLSMPSYADKIEFTHNTEFTAPCAGYIYNQTNARSTHTLQTIISGLEFSSLSYDGNKLNRHNHFLPVSKGDKFKTAETSDVRYFIPTIGSVLSEQWQGTL